MKFYFVSVLILTIWASQSFAQNYPRPEFSSKLSTSYNTDINTYPQLLVDATVEEHDPKFYGRPVWRSIITGLVGKLYFYIEETTAINQKPEAIAISVEFGRAYGHDKVLAVFMDSIHYGRYCYGANDAAIGIFGKPLDKLGNDETIALAILPKDPYKYFSNQWDPEKSVERIA